MVDSPIQSDRIRDHVLRIEAQGRANGDPLPGPLADAWCKDCIMVGDIAVRKDVASDWVIFKQLNSPVLRLIQEITQNPNESNVTVETTPDEDVELAFQFTTPVTECRALLARGRDVFRQAAIEKVGDLIPLPIIKLIHGAVVEQIRRNYETAAKFVADSKEKGETTFFRERATGPKTDTAGG